VNRKIDLEISNRVQKKNQIYYQINQTTVGEKDFNSTKMGIYNVVYLSALLCGSEIKETRALQNRVVYSGGGRAPLAFLVKLIFYILKHSFDMGIFLRELKVISQVTNIFYFNRHPLPLVRPLIRGSPVLPSVT
jgi:hypothetical protein